MTRSTPAATQPTKVPHHSLHLTATVTVLLLVFGLWRMISTLPPSDPDAAVACRDTTHQMCETHTSATVPERHSDVPALLLIVTSSAVGTVGLWRHTQDD